VQAGQITALTVRFTPGKEFKKVLGAVRFEKA
jgi:hypothetical protein